MKRRAFLKLACLTPLVGLVPKAKPPAKTMRPLSKADIDGIVNTIDDCAADKDMPGILFLRFRQAKRKLGYKLLEEIKVT